MNDKNRQHHANLPREIMIDQALTYAIRLLNDGHTDLTTLSPELYNTIVKAAFGCCSVFRHIPVTVDKIAKRLIEVVNSNQKLHELQKVPVVEQRSPEWYTLRKGMVTASDLAQALGQGKFGTQKDFIIKKCGYVEESAFNYNLPALRWGVKYEPVATNIYAFRNSLKVHEFGLIPHQTVSHFGASPDGISDFGVMLEIKCPYRRKIDGTVPTQYYYQIQGQLDVCDLEECDYLECEIEEYPDFNEYCSDTDDTGYLTADHYEKGCVIEYKHDGNDSYNYSYSPIGLSNEAIQNWTEKEIERIHSDPTTGNVKATYWSLKLYHVKRVYRDRAFMEERYKELEVVWDKIIRYKADKALYDLEIVAVQEEVRNVKRGKTTAQPQSSSLIDISTKKYTFSLSEYSIKDVDD